MRVLTKSVFIVLPFDEAALHAYFSGFAECRCLIEELAKLWSGDDFDTNVTKALESLKADEKNYLPTFLSNNPSFAWLRNHEQRKQLLVLWSRLSERLHTSALPPGVPVLIPDGVVANRHALQSLEQLCTSFDRSWVRVDMKGVVLARSPPSKHGFLPPLGVLFSSFSFFFF